MKLSILIGVLSCCLLSACIGNKSAKDRINTYPPLFPDYTSVSIPCNIAPLNFSVKGANTLQAQFAIDGKALFVARGKSHLAIPSGKWKKALQQFSGKDLVVTVSVWNNKYKEGVQYKPFTIHLSADSIDPWIAYRLIEPGYESWHQMEIKERDLTSFYEKTIVSNKVNGDGCINCHSFCKYSPTDYMFHSRSAKGGTVIVKKNVPTKIQLSKIQPEKEGTYPSWHPSGKWIVFSSNKTRQSFHSQSQKKVEVYDLSSDLIVYDVNNNKVITDPRFAEKEYVETFPSWSPDGKRLYFCRAKAQKLPQDIRKLRYTICSVAFDENKGTFGSQIDTLQTQSLDKSASFPRISPDGSYLLYTQTDYATFPIWHKEADLKMINLTDSTAVTTALINSNNTESYHSWSSNGRWIIFSSRRLDGLYTRLFIAWFDREGKLHKPFLLPQKDPKENSLRMKSYNIPEFVSGEISTSMNQLERLLSNE